MDEETEVLVETTTSPALGELDPVVTVADPVEVSPVTTSAAADTGVYDNTISDSVTVYSGCIPADACGIARDLVGGLSDDYFFSVLDEDSYFLIIAKGGIDVDTLEATDCTCYQLDYIGRTDNATSNQYTGYALASSHEDTVQIYNTLGFLSYSNLPDYPQLQTGGEKYAYAEIVLLVLFGISWLFDRIWSHVGNKG